MIQAKGEDKASRKGRGILLGLRCNRLRWNKSIKVREMYFARAYMIQAEEEQKASR